MAENSVLHEFRSKYGVNVETPAETDLYRRQAQAYFNNRVTDLRQDLMAVPVRPHPSYKGLEPTKIEAEPEDDPEDDPEETRFKSVFGGWEMDEPDDVKEIHPGFPMTDAQIANTAYIKAILQIREEIATQGFGHLSDKMKLNLKGLLSRETRRMELSGQKEAQMMIQSFYQEALKDEDAKNHPGRARKEVLGMLRLLTSESGNNITPQLFFALEAHLKREDEADRQVRDMEIPDDGNFDPMTREPILELRFQTLREYLAYNSNQLIERLHSMWKEDNRSDKVLGFERETEENRVVQEILMISAFNENDPHAFRRVYQEIEKVVGKLKTEASALSGDETEEAKRKVRLKELKIKQFEKYLKQIPSF